MPAAFDTYTSVRDQRRKAGFGVRLGYLVAECLEFENVVLPWYLTIAWSQGSGTLIHTTGT